jgi:hypothetical protein
MRYLVVILALYISYSWGKAAGTREQEQMKHVGGEIYQGLITSDLFRCSPM